MAGAGVREPPGRRIEHAVEHAEVHLRTGQLGRQAVEQGSKGIVRRYRGRGVDARCSHDQRHDQRGREAVRRHVAQHHADPALPQPAEGVEVAAHRIGRHASGRHLRIAVQHSG